MSFRTPSNVSPTTGRLHAGAPRTLSSDQRIISSCTTPTECVLVMQIGVVRNPDSRIHSRPVISPFPFSRCVPAKSGCPIDSSACGRIAVTPVRIGPLPRNSSPSPASSVSVATRTPLTSLIALRGPCGKRPIVIPRSEARSLRGMAFSLSLRAFGGVQGDRRGNAKVKALGATKHRNAHRHTTRRA